MPMKGGRLVNFSLLNEKQLNHRTCIGIHNALEVFVLGGGAVGGGGRQARLEHAWRLEHTRDAHTFGGTGRSLTPKAPAPLRSTAWSRETRASSA